MGMPPSAAVVPGRVRRAAVVLGVAAVLVAPLAVVFGQFWAARTDDHGFVAGERRGVRYLGPLTSLISTLSEQQSAAVRGRPTDSAAVRQAVAAVDAVDRDIGGELETTARWTALRESAAATIGLNFITPEDAYGNYVELITEAVQLLRKAGDTSNLILDPQLDTYYVMDAVLVRIPEVIIASGRYADLTYLAVRQGQTDDPERLAQLATLRSQVITPAEQMVDGLAKAFAATQSDTLGPSMLRQLDVFVIAVDGVTPRAPAATAAPARIEPAVVDTAQNELQRLALELDRAALGELETLLGQRSSSIVRQLVLASAMLLVGLLLAAAAAGWLRPIRLARRVRPAGGTAQDGGDPAPGDDRELVTSGPGGTARPGSGRAPR